MNNLATAILGPYSIGFDPFVCFYENSLATEVKRRVYDNDRKGSLGWLMRE